MYYGRLRGTHFKWLDMVALFRNILHVQDPSSDLVAVKFFTAPALARFATHGAKSVEAQSSYHRAMETLYPGIFSIIRGSHSFPRDGALLPTFIDNVPYDRTVRSRVWKIEEKQTDVNIALTMYRDAVKGNVDQMVLCTNDSDAAPTLKAILEDFPGITLGVVAPITGDKNRRLSGSLNEHAHWHRSCLSDDDLENAQLPSVVPTKKKAIRKPEHWDKP